MEKEQWKWVVGYERLYKVSSHGRIESNLCQREKILKPILTSYGYYETSLSKNGVRSIYKIHRLVAIAFLENPENKRCINHKDGNKTNNNVENLEWCSYSENSLHSHRTLGIKTTQNKTNTTYPPKARAVISMNDNMKKVKTYKSGSYAGKMVGINRSAVCNAIRMKIKAGGFYWKYA